MAIVRQMGATIVAAPAFPLISKRYRLHEQLGLGGFGVVYRATDRLTGEDIALKQVNTSADQLMFASRSGRTNPHLALAQEFKTLASLRHPHIVSVLDYGFDDQRRPHFTMDLLTNAQTIVDAGRDQPLEKQVNLLVQMLQALVYLHRRGVLHRDLKPGNVLVTPADGQVKVLDFGLSLISARSVANVTTRTVGTFAYMAPELFYDEPVSRGADLYAVGVMAYELFGGRHPFESTNVAMLINRVLNTPADLSSLDIGDDLAMVLRRLLAKTRAERYGDVGEVIREICVATGQPLPPETIEIRESFLQAAKFVGRESELGQLAGRLDAALDGQGSAWLVGGESGVGKSRLVDELRTLALVEGAVVLRGQSVSEGGSTYQLWRDVLRWLVLDADLEDTAASVLKTLVPDIGALLGRAVPDAPPLDPRPAQNRLFKVVVQLFRQQSQPVVVILEDLQWAESNSLALFQRLSQTVADLPLLLLGDYRDDERPDLPDALPGVNLLKLERLTASGIGELSESMLGPAGRRRQVVELLQRETEGNPFFLVEVVRVLAEEAGQLDQIGSTALPDEVFAGGIQEIVQHRLRRVPPAAQPLLQLAAVAGRELDLGVLQALDQAVNLATWLAVGADVAVLEAQGERWRFAHDKLREGVLHELPEAVRPGLHQRVAEVIETVHPQAPEQAARLAHLWAVAGDPARELHYSQAAGEQAVSNSANVEAIGYLRRALALLGKLPDTPERARQQLDLQLALGVPLVATRGYAAPEVGAAYARARELCRQVGESPQLAPVLFGLRLFYFVRAEYQTAHDLGEQILRLAENARDPALLRVAGHLALAGTYCMSGEFAPGRAHAEQGIAHYDPGQNPSLIRLYGHNLGAGSRSWAAIALQLHGYPDQARERLQEALALAREVTHPYTLTYILSLACWFYQFRRNVETTRKLAEESLALSTEHLFPFFMAWGTIYRGWALAEQGQEHEGLAQMRRGLETLESAGGEVNRTYFLALLAEVYGKVGRVGEGLAVLGEALAVAEDNGERYYEAELDRLRGELLLMQGAEGEAERHYQRAIRVARQQSVRSLELRATASLCRLWQEQGRGKEARQVLAEIYGWFTEGFDLVDLKQARALLDELG